MDKIALGQRIREVRIMRGLTQHTLAQMADIGNMYLGEIERGIKMPSLNVFIKLVDALDISADYILRNEINSGMEYICDDIAQRLKPLTPHQRKTAADILDAYLNSLL